MGNTHTQESIDFLLENYNLIGEENKLKILEDKTTGTYFALKEQCFVNRQEYDRTFKKLTQRNNQNQCENILQLVKIWSKEHNGICSNLFKIYTVYEYPKVKLIDEIEARYQQRKYFQEIQLFSILQSCLNGISYDHQFINISPELIFILPEGTLKLIHADLLDPNYLTMFNQSYYYSPEKITYFHKEHMSCQQIEKETVFSLAMTLLHSAVLKSPAVCYQISMKKFNNRKLQSLLGEVCDIYPVNFSKLLENMLKIDPYERFHMDQVQTAVTEYFNNSSQTIRSRSQSCRIEESIKMATHLPHDKGQDLSLIYSGETFHKHSSEFGVLSHPKKKTTELDFNLQQEEDLPKNHSILQRTKKAKQSYPNKQNIYTDPKIIDLIRSGMQKISRSQDPSYFTLAPREANLQSRQLLPDTAKDPFSDYELTTENKDKCMFIVQTYEDKTHFEGMIQYGMKNGYGRLMYPDGVYYEGNFKNDTLQGKGSLFYGPNRPAFVGDWVENKFHGRGILYNQYPTPLESGFDYRDFNQLGDCWVKYEGEFISDIKEGLGKIVMTNGQIMEGVFEKGLLNGKCVFTTMSGMRVEGQWKNNVMILN